MAGVDDHEEAVPTWVRVMVRVRVRVRARARVRAMVQLPNPLMLTEGQPERPAHRVEEGEDLVRVRGRVRVRVGDEAGSGSECGFWDGARVRV